MKRILFTSLAVIVFLGWPCAVQGQDQGGSSQSGNGGDATVTSTVNSVATVNAGNNVNYNHRQFVQAIPVVTSLFPPYMYPLGTRQIYYPPVYRSLTMDEVEQMRLKAGLGRILFWKKRLRGVVIGRPLPENEKPIYLIPYWPKNIANPGDKVLGSVTVIGDFLEPEELYLGLIEDWAKKHTGTSRIAICFYEINESVTREKMLGLGVAGSRITEPGSDNNGIGTVIGAGVGKGMGRIEKRIVLEALCLNDGPLEAPPMPQPPPEAKVQTPQASAPATPQKVDVYIHVDTAGVKTEPVPSSAPAPQAVPVPPPQAAVEPCSGMPDFAVYFSFDDAAVRDAVEDRRTHEKKTGQIAGIENFSRWLRGHPGCHVEIVGNASVEGSRDYNAGLGLRRANAAYDAFIQAGAPPQQIVRPTVSSGKGWPVSGSEYNVASRRVYLQPVK